MPLPSRTARMSPTRRWRRTRSTSSRSLSARLVSALKTTSRASSRLRSAVRRPSHWRAALRRPRKIRSSSAWRASSRPTSISGSLFYLLSVQFSSISLIVLGGKVSERPVWKDESWAMLETDCDWWTGSEGEAAVSSRQLELRWRSSAFGA